MAVRYGIIYVVVGVLSIIILALSLTTFFLWISPFAGGSLYMVGRETESNCIENMNISTEYFMHEFIRMKPVKTLYYIIIYKDSALKKLRITFLNFVFHAC